GEFHRGQRRMPQIGIHDAEADLDLRRVARDRRCDCECATIERIFRHPERPEAHFFGASGVRGELARMRAFEADAEFANLGHRPTPRSRTPFAGPARTMKNGNATSSRPACLCRLRERKPRCFGTCRYPAEA